MIPLTESEALRLQKAGFERFERDWDASPAKVALVRLSLPVHEAQMLVGVALSALITRGIDAEDFGPFPSLLRRLQEFQNDLAEREP